MRVAQESFELWGGEATVAVARPEHLAAARAAVDRVIAAVDLAGSSFRDDSDLARVNAAAGRVVAVSGMFLDILRAALRAAELTGGLVDPTGAHPYLDESRADPAPHDPDRARAGRGSSAAGGTGGRSGGAPGAEPWAVSGGSGASGAYRGGAGDRSGADRWAGSGGSGASGAGSYRGGVGDRTSGGPGAAHSAWRSIRVDPASAGGAAPRPDGLRDLRRVLPGAMGDGLPSAGGGGADGRPDRPRAVPNAPRPDWRSVRVDRVAGTVCIPAGSSLDLGAIGKAFAADRAAAQAAAETGCGVLVALAGDIAMSGRPPAGGWRVRVTDDHRRCAGGELPPGQDIVLHAPGGLATSSLAVRTRRMPDGRTVNHIVDPRTGMPVHGPWRTVSVSAATCVDANTASTAALVDGHGAGGRLAADGLPARLVHADGWVHTVAGWPTDHSERPGVKVAG